MSNFNEMIPGKEHTNSQHSLVKIVQCIAIMVVAIVALAIVFMLKKEPKETIVEVPQPTPQITVTTISTRIAAASDLVTAKMSYTGLVDSQDGNIPVLTKKHFLMTYHATVSVGYDLSKAAISVDNNTVTITMPPLNTPEINIDTDSIQFFTLDSAIFNWTKKEDGVDAVSIAKDEILVSPEIDELNAQAESQASVLLQQLLKDNIGGRTLTINFS